jgi:predicted rRNA methylase YqxC with S4 and FtsJ domains
LVKPHYEARGYGFMLKKGRLTSEEAKKICDLIIKDLEKNNIKIEKCTESPITGEKGKNIEYLILIKKNE